MTKRDYYEVLSVERSATKVEIKRSFRRLAMKYHPDRHQGDTATEVKFKEVKEAYEVLSDEEKRQIYDRFGHQGVEQHANQRAAAGAGGGFSDMFGDMFSDIFGGGQRRGSGNYAQAGADLRYSLEITLEEAVHGIKKNIDIPHLDTCKPCDGTGAKKGTQARTCPDCEGSGQLLMQQGFLTIQQTCPTCRGEGQLRTPCQKCRGHGRVQGSKTLSVKIPAGVDTGDRIRVPGEGEPGSHGGPTGDLYVQVQIAEHEIFTRNGCDLLCEVPISYVTCVLGGDVEVPTIDGKATLSIPAETQPGKTFRLRNKGVRSIRNATQGDLFCRVNVEVPVKLSDAQKQQLQDFDDSLHGDGNDHSPRAKSWFDKVKHFFEAL